ncbi:type IVB secretion system protein IcmH/DotU [Candidatus Methylocalor cossyra]|uniref:Outer membrane protein ImpK/VasF, OmpA/MotB domain n=1 Tax=Candidatus Methylocalor cossyra TaxID=3108543 RepID=A0ABM9NGL4_9GAMM
MSDDDPFTPLGDQDKTVLRPMPGGRRRAPGGVPPGGPVPVEPRWDAPEPVSVSRNPFLAAAASLLALVARLRSTVTAPAVPELQQELAAELRRFEARLSQRGVPREQVRLGSYALCSLLDETVLNTPWGAQSLWGHQSLLVLFHKETWGGEQFFRILEGLLRQPVPHLDLIELFYVCLGLGFEGRYRVVPSGLTQLERVREEVYATLHRLRGTVEPALSPRWQGLKDLRSPWVRHLPLWVVGAAAGAVLLLAYLGFALAINAASDPVARDLYALAKVEAPLAPRAAASVPVAPTKAARFRERLEPEIAQQQVEVVDDRILRIRNAFPSASDRVKPEFLPLLEKIARELYAGGEAVLVTGHTDDQPIVSARFPSNFDLSTARARHVAEILQSAAPLGGKVQYEGRADYEPLVPNDTAEHRATNRRVDLLVR